MLTRFYANSPEFQSTTITIVKFFLIKSTTPNEFKYYQNIFQVCKLAEKL